MSREDGVEKNIEFLRPLLIKSPTGTGACGGRKRSKITGRSLKGRHNPKE